MSLEIHKRNLLSRFLMPLLGAALMVAAPSVQAQRSYLGTWSGIYPTSSSDNNAACALCHNDISGGGLNPYGNDIANSSAGTITNRIIDVQGDDSDSDSTGSSNIFEINANTQPGWTNATVIPDIDGFADPSPIADANGPYEGDQGEVVQLDGSGSIDPDGTITEYEWDFGDGTPAVTVATPTVQHTYDAAGSYDVTLVVTDDDGFQSEPDATTATIQPIVVEDDPIADPNGPYDGFVGVALTLDGSGSFDPDGGAITQYDWDFGDGTPAVTVTTPTVQHTYAAAGLYTVTLTVIDDEGAQSAPPPAETTAEIALDTDGDGIADAQDNCTLVANGPLIPDAGGNSQLDTDGDNYGNICDPDYNGDLLVNAADLADMKAVFLTADSNIDLNGDGDVNAADLAIMKTLFLRPPGPSGLAP